MDLAPWPAAGRPRERFASRGPASLSDAELVALLLRTGVAGRPAVAVAQELLARFGQVSRLLSAPVQEVAAVPAWARPARPSSPPPSSSRGARSGSRCRPATASRSGYPSPIAAGTRCRLERIEGLTLWIRPE